MLFHSSERKQCKEDRKQNMQHNFFVSNVLLLCFTSSFLACHTKFGKEKTNEKWIKDKWVIKTESSLFTASSDGACTRWPKLGQPCYSRLDRQKNVSATSKLEFLQELQLTETSCNKRRSGQIYLVNSNKNKPCVYAYTSG